MFKILVVEDSQIVRKILNKLVEDNPHFQSVLCADYAQAKAKIEPRGHCRPESARRATW